MSSADRNNFTSFFLINMPFIYITWFVVLARTSKSGHSCLVPGVRGKSTPALVIKYHVSIKSQVSLSIMWALDIFVDALYQVEEASSISVFFTESSYYEWVRKRVKYSFILSKDEIC